MVRLKVSASPNDCPAKKCTMRRTCSLKKNQTVGSPRRWTEPKGAGSRLAPRCFSCEQKDRQCFLPPARDGTRKFPLSDRKNSGGRVVRAKLAAREIQPEKPPRCRCVSTWNRFWDHRAEAWRGPISSPWEAQNLDRVPDGGMHSQGPANPILATPRPPHHLYPTGLWENPLGGQGQQGSVPGYSPGVTTTPPRWTEAGKRQADQPVGQLHQSALPAQGRLPQLTAKSPKHRLG